jgi:hypothetical protein
MYRYSADCHIKSLLILGGVRIGTLHDFRRNEHRSGIKDPQEGKKYVIHHIDKYITNASGQRPGSKKHADALEFFRAVDVSPGSTVTIQNVTLVREFDSADLYILYIQILLRANSTGI